MRLSQLLFSLSLIFIVACSSTPSTIKVKKNQPIYKTKFSTILDLNFRGLVDVKNDQAYFKRCGTEQMFTIQNKTLIDNIYKQITAIKASPVYIEFTGEIVFANDKENKTGVLMRIDRVHYMALAKASLQCAKEVNNFRFKAQGDSPYWRLNINHQKLFLATKAKNQVYQIENINFQTTQINRVKSVNKEGQPLNLTIEPGYCYNLKNNEYWGYTAKINSVWGNWQGCGELGWPHLKHEFSGYYLHKTPDKIVNLTLNKNYSVEYSEKKGKNTVLKTGFWKSNSPDKVVVMLTREENKNIREELIFNRNGLTLHSSQINKNHIIKKSQASDLLFKKMNNKKQQESTVTRLDRQFTTQLVNPKKEVDIEVQQAVNQYFKIHRTDPKQTRFSSITYDLNGDGIKDAIVLLDWCSKDGCEMLIFEGSKNGYRFSSRVSQMLPPFTIAQNQHYLWQSLLIEKNGQNFILDFDGISYRTLKLLDREKQATEVTLFSQGLPENWFAIKE